MIFSIFLMISCLPRDFKNKTKKEEGKTQGLSCVLDCTDEILHSKTAFKNISCHSESTSQLIGSCELLECMEGKKKYGNFCLSLNHKVFTEEHTLLLCDPLQPIDMIDCSPEMPGSFKAFKKRNCHSSGTFFNYEPCEIQTCDENHIKVDNFTCEPKKCLLEDKKKISCEEIIENSTKSYRWQICQDEAIGFVDDGDCILESCFATHIKENLSCTLRDPSNSPTCVDGTGYHSSCSLPILGIEQGHAFYKCINNQYVMQTCHVDKCASTHYLYKDPTDQSFSCEPKLSCIDLPRDLDCTGELLPSGGGIATKVQSCRSDSSGYLYSTCRIISCNEDENFFFLNETCTYIDPQAQCIPGELLSSLDCTQDIQDSSSALKKTFCTENGLEAQTHPCTLVDTALNGGCKSKYHPIDGLCLPDICNTNDPPLDKDCTASRVNSLSATTTYRCSDDSSHYEIVNSCHIIQCKEGFYNHHDQCLPIICNPGKSIYKNCIDEFVKEDPHATRAAQMFLCDSHGIAIQPQSCQVTECHPDYNLKTELNRCILKVCIDDPMDPRYRKNIDCTSTIKNSAIANYSDICNAAEDAYVSDPLAFCSLKECLPGYLPSSDKSQCLIHYYFENEHIFLEEGSPHGFQNIKYTIRRDPAVTESSILVVFLDKNKTTEKVQGMNSSNLEDTNFFYDLIDNEQIIKRFYFDSATNSRDASIAIKMDSDKESNKAIHLRIPEVPTTPYSSISHQGLTIHITDDDSSEGIPCYDSILNIREPIVQWNGESVRVDSLVRGDMISIPFKPYIEEMGSFKWRTSNNLSDAASTNKLVSISSCRGIVGSDALSPCRVSAESGEIKYTTSSKKSLAEEYCPLQIGKFYYLNIHSGSDKKVTDQNFENIDSCPQDMVCSIDLSATRYCHKEDVCNAIPQFRFTNLEHQPIQSTSVVEGSTNPNNTSSIDGSLAMKLPPHNMTFTYISRVAGPLIDARIDVFVVESESSATANYSSQKNTDYYIPKTSLNFTSDEFHQAFIVDIVKDNIVELNPPLNREVITLGLKVTYTDENNILQSHVSTPYIKLYIYDDDPKETPICLDTFMESTKKIYMEKAISQSFSFFSNTFLSLELPPYNVLQGTRGEIEVMPKTPLSTNLPLFAVISECPNGAIVEPKGNTGTCIGESTGETPIIIPYMMFDNLGYLTDPTKDPPNDQWPDPYSVAGENKVLTLNSYENRCRLELGTTYYMHLYQGTQSGKNIILNPNNAPITPITVSIHLPTSP